jgi:hypothetical protein
MIINTPGDCVPAAQKGERFEYLPSFLASVRPLNCMADASRRSSSSGKFSLHILLRVFRAENFLLKRWKKLHTL